MINTEGEIMKCEAHELLEREINRCKDNEQELYSLDRERSKVMAEIQQDLAEIKANHKNMKEDMQEFKKDMDLVKGGLSEVKEDVSGLKTDMSVVKTQVNKIKEITEAQAAKKVWTPKDWAVIIVAALSLAGTVITAILK